MLGHVTILFGTHPTFLEHDTGTHHPERPERLRAVFEGVALSGVEEVVTPFTPRRAEIGELETVHDPAYLSALKRFCLMGGGELDTDTAASLESWEAVLYGAGAGLDALERLRAGEADAAFLALRPPGHHAVPARAMGFCLVNNVAVTARALSSQGERVLIFDYDAHHGNGTQDIFFEDSSVLYVSTHQHPLYPGTGAAREIGREIGRGYTINVPLPEGTNGSTIALALERIVQPEVERFNPDWVIISAGFDAHYRDPLTEMNLTAGDFATLTRWARSFVGPGRTLAFLEGGYDLEALRESTASVLSSLADGEFVGESSRGSAIKPIVDIVEEQRRRALEA